MDRKFERQSVLKGLLLMALLANISWEPGVKSIDLASTGETGSGGRSNNGSAQEYAEPADTDSARPDESSDLKERVDSPQICGRRFIVTYREKSNNGRPLTEIEVRPHGGSSTGFKPFKFSPEGGLSVNYDNAQVKRDNINHILKNIADRLGECPELKRSTGLPPSIAETRSSDRSQDRDREGGMSKEDRESLERGVKACRVNSKGDPLTEVERTRCELQRLSKIDADPDKAGSKQRAMNEIEKLVKGSIRNSIKNRLMSADDSKIEEGEEMLSEAVDTLKDLTSELDLDSRRMARLTGSLEGLRSGGDMYRRSVQLRETVRAARDEMREELVEAQNDFRSNPQDPYATQRLINLQSQISQRRSELQNQVNLDISNTSYTSLQNSQRQGYITSSEFSQFTQPYQEINRDLYSMLQSRTLLASGGLDAQSNSLGALGNAGQNNYGTGLPNDMMNYRNGLVNSFQNNYGMQVPNRQSAPFYNNNNGFNNGYNGGTNFGVMPNYASNGMNGQYNQFGNNGVFNGVYNQPNMMQQQQVSPFFNGNLYQQQQPMFRRW